MAELSLQHVDKIYDNNVQAVFDFNLEVKDKEFIVFVGPSGCGKSTFLKTLNRMNDLVESTKITGDICLDGTDIYKNMDAIELRRRVGMVFQQPNPFPKSIYDNIAYGPRIFGIKKKSELDEIVAETRQDEEKLREKAKKLEQHIEPRLLAACKRIRKNARNGLAVVYIQRDACGGCFNKIPPQRQLDIKLRKKIIVCEYCGRIMIDPELAGVNE